MVEVDVPAERAPRHAASGSNQGARDLRCRVTISRRHETDARTRQVIARLDDAAPLTLLYGDVVTLETEPGRHVLRANNTLIWKRVVFDAEPGEHLEFVLINRAGRFTLGFLAVMGVAPLFLGIEKRRVA